MSAHRDLDRLIQSFLAEGPLELPDPSYDEVRDRMEHKRQRAFIGPWRTPDMNNFMKIGLAAAAVVLVAVVGIAIATRMNVGVPGPNASETPNASTAPIRLLSNQGTMETGAAALAPGTYLLADPFPVRTAITVPGGWVVWHIDFLTAGLLRDTSAGDGSGYGLFFLSPGDKLYADPCDKTRGMLDPVPGSTVDDLATALAGLPGMTASTPTEIEVDGHAGKLIDLTAPSDEATCPDGAATLWDFPGQDDYPMALAERLPIRIIDVDGVRLVIVATDYPGTSAWEVQHGVPFDAADHAEDQVALQAILDSIRINP